MTSQKKEDTIRQDSPNRARKGASRRARAPGNKESRGGASDLLDAIPQIDVSRAEVDKLLDEMENDEDRTERAARSPELKLADTLRDETATNKAVKRLLGHPADPWSDEDRTERSVQAPAAKKRPLPSAEKTERSLKEPDLMSGPGGIVPESLSRAPDIKRPTPAPLPPEHTRRVAIDPLLLAETIPRDQEVTKKSIPLPELLERSANRDDDSLRWAAEPDIAAGRGGIPPFASMEELEHLSYPGPPGQLAEDEAKTPSQTPLPPPPQRSPPPPPDVPPPPPTSGIAEIVRDEPELGRPSPSNGYVSPERVSAGYEVRDSAYSATSDMAGASRIQIGLLGLFLSVSMAMVIGIVVGGALVWALYVGRTDPTVVAPVQESETSDLPAPVASADPLPPAPPVATPAPPTREAPPPPVVPSPAPEPTPPPEPALPVASEEPPQPSVEVVDEPSGEPPSETPVDPPPNSGALSAESVDLPDVARLPIDFRPGSSRPVQVDDAVIERIAEIMTENRRLRLEVVGHVASEEGVDAERVENLARLRAEAAVERIRSHGPSRRRFGARAAAEGEQLTGTATPEGLQRVSVFRVTRR